MSWSVRKTVGTLGNCMCVSLTVYFNRLFSFMLSSQNPVTEFVDSSSV